ncbi:hypothetical protein BD289DRAFT_140418 [Coniella lustricola]|uniref:Uncharacterized protein n=1 Tax=Coniella lustricola TaxID=2025994 RepID=A0A2T3AF83_9PEZI|nr:hypothetical protein BD289DRAFT_140418 [Coniella lustricola]
MDQIRSTQTNDSRIALPYSSSALTTSSLARRHTVQSLLNHNQPPLSSTHSARPAGRILTQAYAGMTEENGGEHTHTHTLHVRLRGNGPLCPSEQDRSSHWSQQLKYLDFQWWCLVSTWTLARVRSGRAHFPAFGPRCIRAELEVCTTNFRRHAANLPI